MAFFSITNKLFSHVIQLTPSDTLAGREFVITKEDIFCVRIGEREVISTDGGSWIRFDKEAVMTYVKDPNGGAYSYTFKKENTVFLNVDEFSSEYESRLLYQNVVITDPKSKKVMRVRFKNYRFFLPVKAELILDGDFDLDLVLGLLSFFWFKKFNSAHDPMG